MTSNKKTFDIYIAIPYTHDDAAMRQARYHKATEYLAITSAAGLVSFSPITHSHPMAYYDLPTCWDFWSNIDLRILPNCHELHVIKMEGWDESVGVAAEIKAAREHGMTITYVCPETFHIEEVEALND